MKKLLLFLTAILFANCFNAQNLVNSADGVPKLEFPKINRQQLAEEDLIRDKQGILYRIGIAQFTNITTENSGVWTTNSDGSRTWKLRVNSDGAEALSILFQTFKIYGNTTFDVLSLN